MNLLHTAVSIALLSLTFACGSTAGTTADCSGGPGTCDDWATPAMNGWTGNATPPANGVAAPPSHATSSVADAGAVLPIPPDGGAPADGADTFD
jgi:hypothetical protein